MDVCAYTGPRSRKQDKNGQLSPAQVLLILQILIRGHQEVATCFFRGLQESTVLKDYPSQLVRSVDRVTRKIRA